MLEMPDLTAFRVDAAGISVKAWLAPSGNSISDRPREIVPWIVIEFANGRPLAELRKSLPSVLRFFSVVSGQRLQATDIVVSRYTEEEFEKRANAELPTPEHRVFRYVDTAEESSSFADLFSTLVSLRSLADRTALEASLAAWIERDEAWTPAAAMMFDSLSKQSVMSASRLLSATRCIEEIPGAGPEKVIAKEHAKALGKVIDRAARKLGYASIGGRFKNAISRVSLETNRERLARLVHDVREVFGYAVVDEHLVDWVAEAFSMRGRAAHGARTAIDDEFDVFARAVEAVECLNLLLMAKELPLGEENQARVSRHPLVQQYRNCTLPGAPSTFREGLREFDSMKGET
ncbi:hypothetical protein [Salinicola halophyticus]|uniref:hypothetical protein n=1 Tax=Salinicola halophyticus TaxID=1808881 RepID=UPI003F48CD55